VWISDCSVELHCEGGGRSGYVKEISKGTECLSLLNFCIVGYDRTNIIVSRTSFVIACVRSSIH
jgi:hypothetical protein